MIGIVLAVASSLKAALLKRLGDSLLCFMSICTRVMCSNLRTQAHFRLSFLSAEEKRRPVIRTCPRFPPVLTSVWFGLVGVGKFILMLMIFAEPFMPECFMPLFRYC